MPDEGPTKLHSQTHCPLLGVSGLHFFQGSGVVTDSCLETGRQTVLTTIAEKVSFLSSRPEGFYVFFFFSVLEMEPGILCTLGNCCDTELSPQALQIFMFSNQAQTNTASRLLLLWSVLGSGDELGTSFSAAKTVPVTVTHISTSPKSAGLGSYHPRVYTPY